MAAAPLSPPSLARLGERATVAPRGRLQLIPKATIGFPAEVCESERGEMEKRSRQRVRDQVARLAFGAETRMRSSARGLSMMAKEHKRSFEAGYRSARPIISRSSFSACNARPVHTDGPVADILLSEPICALNSETNMGGSIANGERTRSSGAFDRHETGNAAGHFRVLHDFGRDGNSGRNPAAPHLP